MNPFYLILLSAGMMDRYKNGTLTLDFCIIVAIMLVLFYLIWRKVIERKK